MDKASEVLVRLVKVCWAYFSLLSFCLVLLSSLTFSGVDT